ncbi:MAG: CehA/McbA family metallohydrolase [Dehalococcoidia bacterium]
MRQKLSFEGVFRPGDPDLTFRYLPFEVPAGAKRLEVTYHFGRDEQPDDPIAPKDVVDIGVFDARGTGFLEGGFRGWSGSSRSGFHISPQDATPGYVRGALAPGEWSIMLGSRIKYSQACPYWVEISLEIDPNAVADADPPDETPARTQTAPRSGIGRWYRGDFHSHTEHSDGYNTIDEYVVEAQRVGLDFLAITDHNTTSHFEEIARRPAGSFLLIPGEEVTTFWGHANVWGTGCWVDFRCTDDAGMRRIFDFVYEQGGLISPNHPKVGYPWEFAGVMDFRVVEAWQGPWRFANEESLAFWERRLNEGSAAVAVGGSDCHSIKPAVFIHPWTLGDPCTWVYVQGELDEEGVLDGVRAGHVFISEDPTGPFLELTATCDGRSFLPGDRIEAPEGSAVKLRLRYRGPPDKKLRLLRDGELWQQVVADKDDVELEFGLALDAPGYLRADVMGLRGRPERGEVVHALTNPMYLRPGSA